MAGQQTIDKALGTHIILDSDNIPPGTVVQTDIGDGTIQGNKIDVFISTEQTGTGSEQDIAHGLGHTPTIVIIQITEFDTTPTDIVQGTHDATNVKVTAVDSAVKFTVTAF